MGSYFRGMSKQDCKKALPKLRSRLDRDIESILRFSYDALCDEKKDLFLHIACFSNNQRIEKVVEHLAKSFLDVAQGIHVLVEKSHISFELGYIRMHSLLAQIGREIVRKQNVREPGQHQFLVHSGDICEVLSDDTIGSKSVIGITIQLLEDQEKINISEKAFEGMSNLQFLRLCDVLVPPNNRYLVRGLNYQCLKLRLLDWRCFPMTYFPPIFNTKFLIELNMRESKLEKLWDGIQPLINLKWMDLRYSKILKKLPDLSTASNLRELNLHGCSSLVELPSSIGNLQELDLTYCSSLVELSSSIGNVTNLQHLNLSHCSNLMQLPSSIGSATNLKELNLNGCSSLVQLPSSIGNATNLQELILDGCLSVVDLLSSIGNAINLENLDLGMCSSLVEFSFSTGTLTNLEKLNFFGCSSLLELPSSIENLHRLPILNLQGCSKLEALPTNINLESLNELKLTGCSLLKNFPEISTNIEYLYLIGTSIQEVPSSLESWSCLKELHMSYSASLKEFPQAFDYITELHVTDTEILEIPPWIKMISRLHRLVLNGCRKLLSLPKLPDSLSILDSDNCESLERIDCSFHNQDICFNLTKSFRLNEEVRDLIIETLTRGMTILSGREIPTCFWEFRNRVVLSKFCWYINKI